MAEKEFTPSCWRYVTLKDLVAKMSEEERQANPLARGDDNIIIGKIIIFKEGCRLIHPDTAKHPSPYQLSEASGSQDDDADSLSSWGSDLTIINIENLEGDEPNDLDGGEEQNGQQHGLEEVEEDSDNDEPEPVYYPVEHGG